MAHFDLPKGEHPQLDLNQTWRVNQIFSIARRPCCCGHVLSSASGNRPAPETGAGFCLDNAGAEPDMARRLEGRLASRLGQPTQACLTWKPAGDGATRALSFARHQQIDEGAHPVGLKRAASQPTQHQPWYRCYTCVPGWGSGARHGLAWATVYSCRYISDCLTNARSSASLIH